MAKLKTKSSNCGIITFHKAHNYGAVLQAYALMTTLKKNGLQVSFIDYENEVLSRGYSFYPILKGTSTINYIKEWIHLILDFKRKYKRFKAFSDFINKYIVCTPLNKDTQCYDIIFIGSDQIWNANYTNGVDPNYYGQGPYCKAHKLVSYAASMGKLCLGKYEEQAFLSLINNIQQIGVRENYLKKYIEEKTDLKCDVNLDPTLLLTKSDWDKLAAPNDTQERYLLIYEMHTHRSTNIIANKIAKILNLKIKKLACRTNYKIEKDVITNAGPQNFLTLFKNAAFVVTTSFHGTVFSIINQVPFFTLEFGNEIDLRSRSLLEMLNLNERMISDDANLNYEKLFLEFDEAHLILESKRQDSLSFIERALS